MLWNYYSLIVTDYLSFPITGGEVEKVPFFG
jgi:hypothetical protein